MEYYSLERLVRMIPGEQGAVCGRILSESDALFRKAPGSTRNHQAWDGGYRDHITEVMNLCVLFYGVLRATGRLSLLPPGERFTLGDALVVLFVHDLEKPWRVEMGADGRSARDRAGRYRMRPLMREKAERERFKHERIGSYGLRLTPLQANALRYVEGMRDADYSPDERVMEPLAALCHMCDMMSARMFYEFPLRSGDPWAPGRSGRA